MLEMRSEITRINPVEILLPESLEIGKTIYNISPACQIGVLKPVAVLIRLSV